MEERILINMIHKNLKKNVVTHQKSLLAKCHQQIQTPLYYCAYGQHLLSINQYHLQSSKQPLLTKMLWQEVKYKKLEAIKFVKASPKYPKRSYL